MKETVLGIQYLHTQGVIHGDMKAANVLLCASFKDRRGYIAKITDFGFSRIATNNDAANFMMKTDTYGTVTHMPPELLRGGLLTIASDIFAVGIIMWEMYTGKAVYQELSDSEVIRNVVDGGMRPIWPGDTPAKYRELAVSCWDSDRDKRPTSDAIMEELDAMQKLFCPHGSRDAGVKVTGTAPNNRRLSLQGNKKHEAELTVKERKIRRASLGNGDVDDPLVDSPNWI
eukprot:gene24635-10256_t